MKVSLFFGFFPYGNQENPDIRKWWTRTMLAVKQDSRIGNVFDRDFDDTPITMSRNACVKLAIEQGCDLLCMVDSDMKPDAYLGKDPGAKPFWDTSLEWMLTHEGPCVVGVPYCGPPPHENVYVFQWTRLQSEHPNPDLKLSQFAREEAAVRSGMQEVGALPTGLILIDLRAIKRIPPPWFEYEYADPPFNTRKSTTEDVYFTRNLSLAGVPQYVNWDAWAIHHKRKPVGKPQILTTDTVKEQLRESIARNWHSNERLIDVRPGKLPSANGCHSPVCSPLEVLPSNRT